MDRQEFLFDVMVAACEGGINYWANVRNYCWNDTDFTASAEIVITEDCDKAGEKHSLTYATIRNGLKAIRNPEFQLNKDIVKAILFADRNNDAGEIDSVAADCIIQAGIFGEIVYG